MATKDINFNIKVNNKALDLTKVSFKEFDKIIKQAKADLKDLPLGDPRYKVLATDIKNAEKAWKAAMQSQKDFKDENDKGEASVKSYSQQIRQATRELVDLENQFGKNSVQYQDQAQKIKDLKDKQEELSRSTLKFDDALSNIPGPIGKVGSSMQQLEVVTQSAKSAFGSLAAQFPILDSTIAKTGIGALVVLLGILVGAVVKALQSSKAFQAALAGFGDAIGTVFDALKPLTDFIVKVFVGTIEIAAAAIEGLASIFGGVSNGFKKQSLVLETTINRDKAILDNYSTFLSEHYTNLLNLQIKYNEKKRAIIDDDKRTTADKNSEILELDKIYLVEKDLLQKKYDKIVRDRNISLEKIKKETTEKGIDNDRSNQLQSLKNQQKFDEDLADSEIKAANGRIIRMKKLQTDIEKIQGQGSTELQKQRAEALVALKQSIEDEKTLVEFLQDQKNSIYEGGNADLLKLQREYNREDIALVNERSNATLQATTELIKEENARNLQASKDELAILIETHRKEIEDAKIAGVTLVNLKEKQSAETKLALEKIRLAQLNFDANELQMVIDQQDRIATEAGKGTEQYFKAREEAITKGFEKEFMLADGNANKQQQARTNQWKAILDLDKEKIQTQIELRTKELDGLYENSMAYFNKEREIELKNYELQQKEYQNNADMLEALSKEHFKKMNMIDKAQLDYASQFLQRQADTERKHWIDLYADLRAAEDMNYKAKLKAAGDNAQEIELINKEHRKRMKEILNDEIQDFADLATKNLDMLANLSNAIGSIYEMEANNTKNSMEDRKKAFEQNKKYQIATAILSAASGVIQILTQPSTLPSPFDWIVKVGNALALGVMTYAQIRKIQSTEFNAGTSGSGSASKSMGKNYGDGGMIEGKRHADGGVPVNAEGGEAIMTRGAVTMFGPLLSMLNQAGGGVSFKQGAVGQANYDNPKVANSPTEPQIIKTYVVESELSSTQHRMARLKDLSTL